MDKLKESKDLLNMMIGYRAACDEKASIITAVFGVIISAILLSGGAETIRSLFNDLNAANIFILILLAVSTVALIIGFAYLIATVIPNTGDVGCEGQKELELRSKAYFTGIAAKSYEEYKKEFEACNETEYLNDVLSEAYLTAKACDYKYRYFKRGVILSSIGTLLLLIALVV